MLLHLVVLVGRFSYGIWRLHTLQIQSQMQQMRSVQMEPLLLEIHFQLQVYALSALVTTFLHTQTSLTVMFQLLQKAIRNQFMH